MLIFLFSVLCYVPPAGLASPLHVRRKGTEVRRNSLSSLLLVNIRQPFGDKLYNIMEGICNISMYPLNCIGFNLGSLHLLRQMQLGSVATGNCVTEL